MELSSRLLVLLVWITNTRGKHADVMPGQQRRCIYTCYPPALPKLQERHQAEVRVNVTCHNLTRLPLVLHLRPENSALIHIQNATVSLGNNPEYSSNFNFIVYAKEFGRTAVIFMRQTSVLPSQFQDEHEYKVGVVRAPRVLLDILFAVVLGGMLLFNNTGFGCKIQLQMVRAILKRPVAPAVGFCCQFLVMAPLSFGVARLLQLDGVAGLGLLTIGSSPGGGGSNVFAILLDADLELSVTMTFLSTLVALGMTPFWLWALGRFFTNGQTKIGIPVANVFASLAIVIIPVLLGVAIANLKPAWAKRLVRILKPFIICMGLVFVGFGTYVYWYAFVRVTVRTLAACLLTPFLGYIIGLVVAKVFRQDRARCITISLETGFQNMALALMMLRISLPQPEADIAGVIPICYMFLSAAIVALVVVVRAARSCCKKHVLHHRQKASITGGQAGKLCDTPADHISKHQEASITAGQAGKLAMKPADQLSKQQVASITSGQPSCITAATSNIIRTSPNHFLTEAPSYRQ